MFGSYKYKNRTITYSEILGWIVLSQKDLEGNQEMKHFLTQKECLDYIDKKTEEDEKRNKIEFWYEKYL